MLKNGISMGNKPLNVRGKLARGKKGWGRGEYLREAD